MDFFLSSLLEPVKQFLAQQGVLEPVLELWTSISVLFEKITLWLGVQAPEGGIVGFLVGVLKLSFQIAVTFVKVLADIVNWIIGLF